VRQINSPPDYNPNAQLGRLQALIQTLQSPANFSTQSWSYPKAVQWTSTTLTTIVVDYSQVTGDNQYYPNVFQFYKNQPTFNLLTQMYDDKQWVVLTWLRAAAYAKTGSPVDAATFLSRAKFFYDVLVQSGWNTSSCGGGMKWGPFNGYKNSVTTELFVASSIGMYEAFGTQGYLDNAVKAWTWFKNSGLINPQGLINDGLTDTCQCVPARRETDLGIMDRRRGLTIKGLCYQDCLNCISIRETIL
jgi:predicted alpha-1,6-mannanase (GH76 family)